MINPAHLDGRAGGVEAAQADLFKNGLVAIVSPPGVSSEAIKLATDLSHLLGAEHLFVDPLELDSLMAGVHTLPQLLAAALLDVTVDQPGWREARKLAGRPFAQVTGLSAQFGSPRILSQRGCWLTANRYIRLTDKLIDSLAALRKEIYEQDTQALVDRFTTATSGRERWLQQREPGGLGG